MPCASRPTANALIPEERSVTAPDSRSIEKLPRLVPWSPRPEEVPYAQIMAFLPLRVRDGVPPLLSARLKKRVVLPPADVNEDAAST